MSIRESFSWVALPVGRTAHGDRACRVSVFIAPQVTLTDEPERILRLDELTDLLDWPATLAAITFDVEFEGVEPVAAHQVGRPAQSSLWRALFPVDTRVIPFVPDDAATHTVVGYGVMDVMDTIEAGYAEAAPLDVASVNHFDPAFWDPGLWMPERTVPAPPERRAGTDSAEPRLVGNLFPAFMRAVAEPGNAWLNAAGAEERITTLHARSVDGVRRDVAFDDAGPIRSLADLEAVRFAETMRLAWRPLESSELTDASRAGPDPQESLKEALRASYDLHRIIAALGDHAPLLRALGLVVDLEVPVEPPASGRMRVLPRRAGNGDRHALNRTPWTAVTNAGPVGFAAASATDNASPPGLESLARFHVVQLDVESAGAQLLDAAANEQAGLALPGVLPSLRTAGLRLVEVNAAEHMMEHGARVNELRLASEASDADPGSADTTLDADALQRGVRVDVLDVASGHWHSLHGRNSTYSVDGEVLIGPVAGEGSVAGSFTGRPLAPGASLPAGDVVQVDEALLTWTGWSLSAPRPGGVISADPLMTDAVHREAHGGELIGRPDNTPLTSTDLRIDTTPLRGSLPRLRFGREYRVRLRAVDLAGNALTVAEADAATVGTGAGAAVSDPILFRRFEPVPPPVPAFAEDPAATGTVMHGDAERRLIVRSGMDEVDALFGEEPGVTERLLFPPSCSVSLAEWHGAFDDAIGQAATDADVQRGYDRAARESGSLHPSRVQTPWLADPASSGVCLTGLPGAAVDAIVTMPWPATPTGPGPIRLRVTALSDDVPRPPRSDQQGGLIEVFLPPGARAAVEVSSMLADPVMMAVPANWRARLTGDALAAAEAKLARHRHPLVTPPLPLELVHAVQRPFLVPTVAEPVILTRSPDETTARIRVPWSVHAPSTATLEMIADWTVPLDDPVPAGSERALGPSGDGADGGAGRHGGARFVPAAATVRAQVGSAKRVELPAPGQPTVRSVTVIDRPAADGAAARDETAMVDLDSTGHLRLRLRAVATSRFGEFFPPEFGPADASADDPARPSRLTRESEVVVVDAPSTRRPPAPVVTNLLPLLVRHADALGVHRQGGWLRVWFARPWFASGWDESPAILAGRDMQPSTPGGPDWQLTTLVGPDPARQAPEFGGVTTDSLSGVLSDWFDVRLPETAGLEAAGLAVPAMSDCRIDFDPARNAWFTDIRVDTPSLYFPFVRLALATHQPDALIGSTEHAHQVSPVITPDPVQVLPDRELTIQVQSDGVRIGVAGRTSDLGLKPVNRGSEEFPDWFMEPMDRPSAARVVVQKRGRSGGDDLLAWDDQFDQFMNTDPEAPRGHLAASTFLPFDPTQPPGEFRAVVIEEDFAFGPRISSTPEEDRPRPTFVEIVPLPRAVAPG